MMSKQDLFTCPLLLLAGAALIIEVPDETNITGVPADEKRTGCQLLLVASRALTNRNVQLRLKVDDLVVCLAPFPEESHCWRLIADLLC